jgi:hypothetical protein
VHEARRSRFGREHPAPELCRLSGNGASSLARTQGTLASLSGQCGERRRRCDRLPNIIKWASWPMRHPLPSSRLSGCHPVHVRRNRVRARTRGCVVAASAAPCQRAGGR